MTDESRGTRIYYHNAIHHGIRVEAKLYESPTGTLMGVIVVSGQSCDHNDVVDKEGFLAEIEKAIAQL